MGSKGGLPLLRRHSNKAAKPRPCAQAVRAIGAVTSDEFRTNFSAGGSDRGDIVQQIIAIVSEVARGLPPGGSDPLDVGMPGG